MDLIENPIEFGALEERADVQPSAELLEGLAQIAHAELIDFACLQSINLPATDASLPRDVLLAESQAPTQGRMDACQLLVGHWASIGNVPSRGLSWRLSFVA